MTGDQQIAALREEIRRAGRATAVARTTVLLLLGSCVALPTAIYFHVFFQPDYWSRYPNWFIIPGDGNPLLSLREWCLWFRARYWTFGTWGYIHFSVGPCATLLGIVISSLSIATVYRRLRILPLRRRLVALSPEQAIEALRGLNGTRGDTRKIAASLDRGLRRRLEIAPAPALDARGDEPSPAENEP
jgi:hypothetical protein